MRTRLGIAVLAALGGLVLVISGVMALRAGSAADWHRPASAGGYAVGLGALVLVGYGLVDHAPVWLRLVVSVGLPLLAAMVWQVASEELDTRMVGWRADAWTHLGTGVVLLLIGVLTGRRSGAEADRYQPSHR